MRASFSAQWVPVASIAVLVLFLTPLPAFTAPMPERYVLVELGASGLGPVQAVGATVVEQYGSTYALLRVTNPQAIDLRVSGVPVDEMPDRTIIEIPESDVRFDTSVGAPAVPADLQMSTPNAFIVQFIGPAKAEWLTNLKAMGAFVDIYAPNNAWVVRTSQATAAAIADLPYVNWVGPFEPAYRISSDLKNAVGPTRIGVLGFDDASAIELAAHILKLGGSDELVTVLPKYVQAVIDGSRIPDVARLDGVAMIYSDPVRMTLDSRAGIVHGFSRAWYRDTSGLPTTLTGVSPGPDGIRGTADDVYQIAGITDTGFDEGSATAGPNDFFQGPFDAATNDRVIRVTDQTGCSTPDGLFGGRVAHGTHVAGIVASNGWSWEDYLIQDLGRTDVSLTDFRWDQSEAGVAPEAKITVDAVNGCSGGVLPSPQYWLDQYSDGARVNVNSWGGGAGTYNGNAQAVDTQMVANPDQMVEFSAGNGGPDYNTLSGDAQAKNGIATGASENFRPDQFDADNPDLVASFSSKGGPMQSYGRIKPDLLAVGTAVISLFARGEWEAGGMQIQPDYITAVDKYNANTRSPGSDGIADYRYLQGTSMAGPMAAGLYLLAREFLMEEKGIATPSSQLVKAYLINGAVRMNPLLYRYPSWDQGWGRIDLPNSLFPAPPKTVQYQEGTIATTGGTWSPSTINTTVASARVPLKVTLDWIDPQAFGGALVRNLNLKVTSPSGAVYCGNNYNSAGWSNAYPGPSCGAGNTTWDTNGDGWDEINNVEQVEVQTPETGTWQVLVIGAAVPSPAPLAMVVSADVGPQSQYRVDVSTTSTTILPIAPGGSANLPFVVTNYGTVTDKIDLSNTITVPFIQARFSSPTSSVTLPAGKSADQLAMIQVAAGSPAGSYVFNIVGTSANDPNPLGPSTSSIAVTIEVRVTATPSPIVVANGTTDEFDPSIVVFNSTAGVRHILIAYRKVLPTSPNGKLGGVNVWVGQTTLDNSGMPILPFQQASVSSANDLPNDLRLLRISTGTYIDRVVITWTGTDPNVTNPDAASYGRMAWADAPYTTWNLVTMETNFGSRLLNVARVSFPLFRRGATAGGELMWVWEHLDYNTLGGNPLSVQTHFVSSYDGGVTWSPPSRIFPLSGTDANFYFFPHGAVDQNDVAWIFAYFRTPTGNNRDLVMRLYDGTLSATAPVVFDTTDNIQWPAVLSTAEGPHNNRVYVAVTRDYGAVDLKLNMLYINGTATPWSSSHVPAARSTLGDNCGVGCRVSTDFAGPFGPFASAASNANYNRRPILNLVATNESGTHYVWLPYMESNNPYGTPNMWTYYGQASDWMTRPALATVTADGYAKGHQMTDTLTTGGVARLYETYHASRQPMTSVNYNIYLEVYWHNWTTGADAIGPITTLAVSTPRLVDLSVTGSMLISANVNDMDTGNSTIAGAEYEFDTLGAPGTGHPLAPSDGAFDSPTEGVQILAGVPTNWTSPSCHIIYIRGQDVVGNWGAADATQVCIQGNSGPDIFPPEPATLTSARLVGAGFNNVELRWRAATDEGFSGGTIEYRVWRSPAYTGPWALAGPAIPAAGLLTYVWTDNGVGSNTYFYRVESRDAANNTANSTRYAGRTEFAAATGLNFLSVPFEQYDTSLVTVFQTLSVRGAWSYDAFSRAWLTYSASRPMGQNNLQRIPAGAGLYVDLAAAGTYAVAGLVYDSNVIALAPGWNFVGYPTMRTGYTVANLKAEIGALSVLGFAVAAPGNTVVLPDATALAPGSAYWIKIGAGGATWTVPGH